MAKKPFGWVRDAEEPVIPSPHRVSRSEAAEEVDAADAALEAVLALLPVERELLPLDAALVREIEAYERVKPKNHTARKRQYQLLRKLFRQYDLEELEEALEGTSSREEALAALVRWRDRLVDEGDEALHELLEAYPTADRQAFRTRIRQARSTDHQAAGRARKAMMAALRELADI